LEKNKKTFYQKNKHDKAREKKDVKV